MPTKSSKHEVSRPLAGADVGMPGWPSVATLVVIGATYLLVSGDRTLGPNWLLPGALALTVVAALLAEYQGAHSFRRWLVICANALVTLTLIVGAGSLIYQLVLRNSNPVALLRDATLLWILNVMAFALWFWELDNGGPMCRSRSPYRSTDFLFPQMQTDSHATWSPSFVDYVFLAFNTNTAFSPTDTLIVSRPAKLLMMLQSAIALIDVVVIAARAVNSLQS